MKYDDWYKARAIVEDFLTKDLLGPVNEDEIIEDEPLRYYTLGKLYPQQSEIDITETRDMTIDGLREDVGESFDACVSLSNTYNPSSMALTFTLSPHASSLKAVVKAAKYEPVEEKIYYGTKTSGADENGSEEKKEDNGREKKKQEDGKYIIDYKWKRVPLDKVLVFPLKKQGQKTLTGEIAEGLEGKLYINKVFSDGAISATFAVVNTYKSNASMHVNNQNSFFQVEVSLESEKAGEEIFIEKRMHASKERDYELLMFDMLYSHVRNYAVGHGCSVEWVDGVQGASKLLTKFIPQYELLQMKPATRLDSPVFKMEFLAFSDRNVIVNELKKLVVSYEEWIEKQKNALLSMASPYIEIAKVTI